MANLSFSTTNWAAWFATPNQLAQQLSQSMTRAIVLLEDLEINSESLTPTTYAAQFDNQGTLNMSGQGFDTDVWVIDEIRYSEPDPSGNTFTFAGNLHFENDGESIFGTLSNLSFRFFDLEMSAAGSLGFDTSGKGSGSYNRIMYRQSGWTFESAGNVNYQGFQASGTLDYLTVTSPQGDRFSVSNSAKLTAPILNGIQSTGKGMGFFLSESFLDGNDTITASERNDRFSGYAGNDVLLGGDGHDTLAGGAGNDTLDGGRGVDSAMFSGKFAQYSWTTTGDVLRVQTNAGSDGIDTLSGIERLGFADQSVALDVANGNAGTTARILGVVFGPSFVTNKTYAGIALSLLDGGMSCDDLIALALRVKLGEHYSNAAEVEALYQNLFGHAPTTAEVTFWSTAINTGQFSQVSLAKAAANLDINAVNIDLVGLMQTGLGYLPFT